MMPNFHYVVIIQHILWFSILPFNFNVNGSKGVLYFKTTSCNSLSSDTVLYSFGGVSVEQCVNECASLTDCLVIYYKRRFKLCELHSTSEENVVYKTGTKGACVTIVKHDIYIGEDQFGCSNYENESRETEHDCCRKFCPALKLQNGTIFGNMNSEGSRVEYTCNKYFQEQAGRTYAVCQQNCTWTHIPMCFKYFEYMGCYEDRSNRTLGGAYVESQGSMTTEYCLNFCFCRNNNEYALTENGKQCFCGNVPRFYEDVDEPECNKPCTGDRSEICGGKWRASLYKRIDI